MTGLAVFGCGLGLRLPEWAPAARPGHAREREGVVARAT
jgi:hypothetical protein